MTKSEKKEQEKTLSEDEVKVENKEQKIVNEEKKLREIIQTLIDYELKILYSMKTNIEGLRIKIEKQNNKLKFQKKLDKNVSSFLLFNF